MKISPRVKKISTWLIAFFVCVLLLNSTPVRNITYRLNGALYVPIKPFRAIARGVSSFFFGILHGVQLQNEVTELREALAKSVTAYTHDERIASYDGATSFFDTLSSSFGLPIVRAYTVAYTSLDGMHLLVVNRGKEEGIELNMPAITPEGVFIGKVRALTAHTASIQLVTDEGSGVAVTVSGRPESQAILKGVEGESLFLDLIPQDIVLTQGDIVFTSIIESNTPPGLPIGRITKIAYADGELFQTASVQPLVSLSYITNVGIILPQR